MKILNNNMILNIKLIKKNNNSTIFIKLSYKFNSKSKKNYIQAE